MTDDDTLACCNYHKGWGPHKHMIVCHGWGSVPPPPPPATVLQKMRIPLPRHHSDVLMVADQFKEGSRYVHIEVPRYESNRWDWEQWDEAYEALAVEWHGRYRDPPVPPIPPAP